MTKFEQKLNDEKFIKRIEDATIIFCCMILTYGIVDGILTFI